MAIASRCVRVPPLSARRKPVLIRVKKSSLFGLMRFAIRFPSRSNIS